MDLTPAGLPIKEVCARLGLSRSTITRMRDAGILKATDPATTSPRGRVYITLGSIVEYERTRRLEHRVAG